MKAKKSLQLDRCRTNNNNNNKKSLPMIGSIRTLQVQRDQYRTRIFHRQLRLTGIRTEIVVCELPQAPPLQSCNGRAETSSWDILSSKVTCSLIITLDDQILDPQPEPITIPWQKKAAFKLLSQAAEKSLVNEVQIQVSARTGQPITRLTHHQHQILSARSSQIGFRATDAGYPRSSGATKRQHMISI
jgi:hypothetical protein